MEICARCGGFRRTATCPHCGSRGVAKKVVLGAIAFTLMACYGRPPCKDGTQKCHDVPPASAGDDASPARDAAK